MADIEQEEKEAPGKFLDRLREALHRFTEIDPESEEGKVILKDRFLTQSAPDIRRKLLKQAYGPNQELLRGSQAPRRAVCGTRGSLRTMHGGVQAVKWNSQCAS